MSKDSEAIVKIGSITLNYAESMTLRVAVTSMLHDLADKEYMEALGEIGPLYRNRLLAIQSFIHKSIDDQL